MALQSADCSLILDTQAHPSQAWCAFEHIAALEPGAPPAVIFVGACRLIEVYRLADGRTNSEWTKIYANGGTVQVRIIATGDRLDVMRHAQRHARTFDPLPRCNMYGYNVRGASRAIRCSNGQTYPTQRDAALALGVSQSAISQQLDGKLLSVRGFTFSYTTPDAVGAPA
jgi:hypothetical protein